MTATRTHGSKVTKRDLLLSYGLQSVSTGTTATLNLVIPLALGARGYAAFLQIVGVGYLTAVLMDQALNALLAYRTAIASRQSVIGILLFKLLVLIPALPILSALIGGPWVAIPIGALLGTAFVIVTTLDTWLVASGSLSIAIRLRILAAFLLIGVSIGALWFGVMALALATATAYAVVATIYGLTCLRHRHGNTAMARPSDARVSLAGTSFVLIAGWQSLYSWLLPLLLIRFGNPILGADLKLATSLIIGAIALAPIPPTVYAIAINARSAFSTEFKQHLLRGIAAVAAICAAAAPATVLVCGALLDRIFTLRGFQGEVPLLLALSIALFPVMVNPTILARHIVCRHRYLDVMTAALFIAGYLASIVVAVFAASLLVPILVIAQALPCTLLLLNDARCEHSIRMLSLGLGVMTFGLLMTVAAPFINSVTRPSAIAQIGSALIIVAFAAGACLYIASSRLHTLPSSAHQ